MIDLIDHFAPFSLLLLFIVYTIPRSSPKTPNRHHGSNAIRVSVRQRVFVSFRFVVVIQMTEWPSWVFSPACLSLSLSPSLSFSFPVCFFLCFSSFILHFTLSCPKWWRCLPVCYLLIGPKENQCRQSYKHTKKKETGIPVHLLNGVREAASNRNSAEPTKSARLNCVSLPLSLVLVRPTCVFHRHREIIH